MSESLPLKRGDLVERRGVRGTVTHVSLHGWTVVHDAPRDNHRACSYMTGSAGDTPEAAGWTRVPLKSDVLGSLALDLRTALHGANLGGYSATWDDATVLVHALVTPAADLQGENLYRMLGDLLAWRNAGSFLDGIGRALGEAMHEELCGNAVPDGAGWSAETVGQRVYNQLHYNCELLPRALESVLSAVLNDPKADLRDPTAQ